MSYEYEKKHLNGKDALERFRKEKASHPNSLITLEDLDCGHWTVNVYETEVEKEAYLRKKLSDMISSFWSSFKK